MEITQIKTGTTGLKIAPRLLRVIIVHEGHQRAGMQKSLGKCGP